MDDKSGESGRTLWGQLKTFCCHVHVDRRKKTNKKKKQESGRETHLKVTHSAAATGATAAAAAPSSLGQKASSPAAFHLLLPLPLPPIPPPTLPASFSPLKEGLIVAMSAVSRAPGTKTLFTPLHILLASVTLSPLTHSLALSLSPPRLPRIMQSPRLFATPSPPPCCTSSHRPSPTPNPAAPLFLLSPLFWRASERACVRACVHTLATEAQGQVEVVTEMMVVCDAAEMLSRSPKAL